MAAGRECFVLEEEQKSWDLGRVYDMICFALGFI